MAQPGQRRRRAEERPLGVRVRVLRQHLDGDRLRAVQPAARQRRLEDFAERAGGDVGHEDDLVASRVELEAIQQRRVTSIDDRGRRRRLSGRQLVFITAKCQLLLAHYSENIHPNMANCKKDSKHGARSKYDPHLAISYNTKFKSRHTHTALCPVSER